MIKKAKEMNNPSTSKRALDTIKLIGNQVIEIRDILNQQLTVIQRLEKEVIRLKSTSKENEQNVKILQIDQRDILRQVQKLKEGHTVMSTAMDHNEEIFKEEAADILFGQQMQIDEADKLNKIDDLLGYDEQEIGSKFYPNYKLSKVVENNERTKAKKQQQQKQRPNIKPISKQEMTKRIDSRVEMLQEEVKNRVKKADKLSFDRIPRLLNLD